ncbi:MAG: MarR family transcriptional regulator [Pseudomonadota bacterium]
MSRLTPKMLHHLHRAVQREWAKSGRALPVTQSEFDYLSAIADQAARPRVETGPHGQHLHDIVADLGVSTASASAMVAKLARRGLVTRHACHADARAHHIILTAAGADLLAQGMEVYAAVAAAFAADSDAEPVSASDICEGGPNGH